MPENRNPGQPAPRSPPGAARHPPPGGGQGKASTPEGLHIGSPRLDATRPTGGDGSQKETEPQRGSMCASQSQRIWNPSGVRWFLLFSTPGGPYGATGGYPYGTPLGFEKERHGNAAHKSTKPQGLAGRGGEGVEVVLDGGAGGGSAGSGEGEGAAGRGWRAR